MYNFWSLLHKSTICGTWEKKLQNFFFLERIQYSSQVSNFSFCRNLTCHFYYISMKLVLMCVFQNCRQKKGHVGMEKVTKNCNFSQIRFSRIASNFKLGNGFWTYYEEEERKMFFALYEKSHMYSVSKWGFSRKKDRILLFWKWLQEIHYNLFRFCSKMHCMFPYWPPKLHLEKFSVSQENVSILPYI